MDSEDDICVLQHSDDDIEEDAAVSHFAHFSPFSAATGSDYDRGCHFALKKAYLTLKQKLNETTAQNRQLARKVQELESSKYSSIGIGESFDMMEDARYIAEGAAGTQPPEGSAGVVQLGFASNMRQQLNPVPSQAAGAESRFSQYKERTPDKEQVALLQQENSRLQQGWEAARREKEAALQSLQELRERCSSLLAERDLAMREGASLQASLQKANMEMAALKERQGENSNSDPPAELLGEMANMRRVIEKLKAMVLMQKDCLVNRSMSLSRTSLNRDALSMESPSQGSGGSHSGQSWEMVNGAATQPTDPRQQQLLQQRSAKIIPVDLDRRRGGASGSPPSAGHQAGNAGKPAASLIGPALKVQNGRPGLSPQNGPTLSSAGQGPSMPRSKTDVIHRRHSQDDVHQPKEKVEVTRAHTLPQQTPRLAEWMGSHYQQQQQQQHPQQQQAGRATAGMQPGAVGLNQLIKDPANGGPARGVGHRVNSPSQPGNVQYPPSAAPYLPPRQTSPQNPSSGTYDNIAVTPATGASTGSTIVPSMHILNQSSMTGARVLQNSSPGSFGSGGTSPAPSNPQPAIVVGINRDGAGPRGAPQEHSEIPRPRDPTDLELNTAIRFANELPGGQAGSNAMDRKCPVCGQDFGHLTMDEFQTHVFECFDDADDSSHAPETLQPQRGQVGSGSESSDRACPMCQKVFADTVTQQFYESHVQSHFEDVVDHFEVLDLNRT